MASEKNASAAAPKRVPVECWSGIEQIDAPIAPLIKAWSATGWLVPQESCAGHGQHSAYVTVNVRLDHLAGFIGFLRSLDAELGADRLDRLGQSVVTHVTLHHRTFVWGTVWTEQWGTLDIAIGGTGPNRSLTGAELKRFVALAKRVRARPDLLDDEADLAPRLRAAMAGRGSRRPTPPRSTKRAR